MLNLSFEDIDNFGKVKVTGELTMRKNIQNQTAHALLFQVCKKTKTCNFLFISSITITILKRYSRGFRFRLNIQFTIYYLITYLINSIYNFLDKNGLCYSQILYRCKAHANPFSLLPIRLLWERRKNKRTNKFSLSHPTPYVD